MILEIEYYKGDTLLIGKAKDESELKKQIARIASEYDAETDDFVELLCRKFGWTVLQTYQKPDYTYDRDIEKIYKPG